jgi:hypothetical protein
MTFPMVAGDGGNFRSKASESGVAEALILPPSCTT